MSEAQKILVVDDEPDILEFLSYNLKKEGFEVFTANNGIKGIEAARLYLPDLIILDVMMPGMDGITVCQELRSDPKFEQTIIAFLTARGNDLTEISGLDSGGDAYITKPIRPRVLIARLQALLRRSQVSDTNEILKHGNLVINKDEVMVYKDEKAIQLVKKEFELLFLLAGKPNKVFTREEIFRKVWGSDFTGGLRTIDVHIRKLREKIGAEYIKTIKGMGYKFEY